MEPTPVVLSSVRYVGGCPELHSVSITLYTNSSHSALPGSFSNYWPLNPFLAISAWKKLEHTKKFAKPTTAAQ